MVIVPVLFKIIKKIMYDRSNLLLDAQHSFRKERLTRTVVIRLEERISDAIEKEELLGLTLLELSKAFDIQ